MKKLFLLFLVSLSLSLFNHSFSQSDKKNLIKVNLLSPIVRTGSFFYERVINEKSSAQLGFFYTGWSSSGTQIRGYGITPEYRFYVSNKKQSPQGFFVAPFLRHQSLNLSLDSGAEKATLSSFGGGLMIGGQWLFSDVISLDVFGGPNYNARSFKATTNGTTEEDFTLTGFGNFGFRFGVSIGFAF
jgi:hypothetical protein